MLGVSGGSARKAPLYEASSGFEKSKYSTNATPVVSTATQMLTARSGTIKLYVVAFVSGEYNHSDGMHPRVASTASMLVCGLIRPIEEALIVDGVQPLAAGPPAREPADAGIDAMAKTIIAVNMIFIF